MSLKSKYKFGPSLPGGSALDWDMTKLTDDQLEYEHHLAYESLYGHKVDGIIRIKGYRDPEYQPPGGFSKEMLSDAESVWTLRFTRAEDELERRFLLS